MQEIENAKITDVYFGLEDHGCLTLYLTLEGAGWGCSYGGWNLAGPHAAGCIKELLITLDEMDLYKLNNKVVRCKFEDQKVIAVGDIIKNKWFSFKDYFEQFED